MSLRGLHEEYHNKIQFITIYITEIHPVDGWWLGKGIFGLVLKLTRSKAAIDVYQPNNIEERRVVATRCQDTLRYGINTYVDNMDDEVNKAYAALPTRLYLIGRDGIVVYAGGLGPWGFKPKELRKAIKKYLNSEC